MALRGIDNRDKPAHVACYTQYRVALRLRVSRVRNKDAAARKSLETEEEDVCGWWSPGLGVAGK